MVRILVTPEKLDDLSRQISQSVSQLNEIENRLGQILGGLDWNVRQQVNIDNQVQTARQQARRLSDQAEELARFLAERARAFQQADSQGVDRLNSLQVHYRHLFSNSNSDTLHEILSKIKNVMKLGEFLGAAMIVALSLRSGTAYPGEVIINLPDALRNFKGLREIRELAGLSGHLNHFSYVNLPSKIWKWGVLFSIPEVAEKWMTDIAEYQGTRRVSAMAVDTALTLAPVVTSFVVSQTITWGATALGTFLFPGAGTAAGYAVGAATVSWVSGAMAKWSTEWAINHYSLREQAIEKVDNLLQPVVQSIQNAYQQLIFSPT